MLSEEDVAAAAALVVGFGHVVGKRAAGEVGIAVGVIVVGSEGVFDGCSERGWL